MKKTAPIEFSDKRNLPVGILADGKLALMLPSGHGCPPIDRPHSRQTLPIDWEFMVFDELGHAWREMREIPLVARKRLALALARYVGETVAL